MLVAELKIPQMFTAYAEDLGYLQNGLHHYQYFCEECDQAFSSAWGRIPGSMSCYERGSYFICPYCGYRHHENVVYIKRDVSAPNKIRLSVKEYENIVTLEVVSETVEFRDFLHLSANKWKEVFRFDIRKQTATLTIYNKHVQNRTIQLGNPLRLELLKESILWYFHSNSLANSKKRFNVSKILKVLRETIHRKLEKYLGHKVSSMFVSHGQFHGTFLLPIFNIAYRMACPDAPNLPVEYRESPKEIESYWKSKLINHAMFNVELDSVFKLTRRNKDFVSAIIKTKSLPDKPFVRRELKEYPFNLSMLAYAFKLCENYDCAMRVFEGLKTLCKDSRFIWSINDNLLHFLQDMKPIYGEVRIANFIEDYEKMQLWDCVSLFYQLNKENQKALKTESVRPRDLHDWMSLAHKKQTHVNLKFSVPEHIINRLSMQRDRLSFFMPKESMQLLEAGCSLHNCVASYGRAMKDNEKWIVLVANNKGKLAACLEIKGNELMQAKLDRNKPVLGNEEINKAIIAWAKETNLKIKTSDVKVPKEKKLKTAVSA